MAVVMLGCPATQPIDTHIDKKPDSPVSPITGAGGSVNKAGDAVVVAKDSVNKVDGSVTSAQNGVAAASANVALAAARQDSIKASSGTLPVTKASQDISNDATEAQKDLAVTKAQLEKVQTDLSLAKHDLEQSRGALDQAQKQLDSAKSEIQTAHDNATKQDIYIATLLTKIDGFIKNIADLTKQIDWDSKYGTKLFAFGTIGMVLSVVLGAGVVAAFIYPMLQPFAKLFAVASGAALTFGILCFQYLEFHDEIFVFIKYAIGALLAVITIYLVFHFWHNSHLAKAEVKVKSLEADAASELADANSTIIEGKDKILSTITSVMKEVNNIQDPMFKLKCYAKLPSELHDDFDRFMKSL